MHARNKKYQCYLPDNCGSGALDGYMVETGCLVETTDWICWDVVGGFAIVGIIVASISDGVEDCVEIEKN